MAHSITALRRWRTRRAVSGWTCQSRCTVWSTSALVTSLTGRWPRSGKAKRVSVDHHCWACFALRHAGRFWSSTCAAASATVGMACTRRLSASGSLPSRASFRLARALDVQTLFIEPGSPWENGYVESFNGKLRDELLDREIFYTLMEATVLIERWRREYNTVRPHTAQCARLSSARARGGQTGLNGRVQRVQYECSSLIRTGTTMGGGSVPPAPYSSTASTAM